MSDTKHTPGPWRVTGPLGYGLLVTSDDPAFKQIAVVYGAVVNRSGPDNAHLIAAAPNLLAALESAPEPTQNERYSFSLNGWYVRTYGPWLRARAAALAKARGKA